MQATRADSLPLSEIANKVHAALLADRPDPLQLENTIAQDLQLLADEVRRLIYAVVLELNKKFFPPVTKLELIHTEGCNLACSYCFEKNMLGYRRMPQNIAQSAVDILFDYSQDEIDLEITHFGGEPTLNFAAIRYVTQYSEAKALARGKSIHFTMTSNGVLIDEEMADFFAEHKIEVLLSVDGLEESHNNYRVTKRGLGTFQDVMKGLRILKTRQPHIGVKMTVMPDNCPRLYDDVCGLYDRGVNYFIVGHATGVIWTAEAMEVYAQQWTKLYQWHKETLRNDLTIEGLQGEEFSPSFGCQAGRNSISVGVDGQISPCSKILGINSRELVSKLGDIQYGLTHFRNRLELASSAKVKSACESQGIDKEYSGGCFAANYEDNGDIFQPSLQEHTISLLKRSACAGCSSCGK
jgi:uncharacterized protein